MTKWRAPDGKVFDESEINDDTMSNYFTEEDFEEKLDEWYEPLIVNEYEIYASEIIRQLRPYMFSEMYDSELYYYSEDPEMLGFERIADSSSRRKSSSEFVTACKKASKKKSTSRSVSSKKKAKVPAMKAPARKTKGAKR